MTEEELAAIEARAAAASPGPWIDDEWEGIVAFKANDDSYDYEAVWLPAGYHRAYTQEHQLERDAAFIAHARTDIPALVAEVRRLRSLDIPSTRA